MATDNVKDDLSDSVLQAVFEVSRTLKTGFLEKVYEKALVYELQSRGFAVAAQVPVPVFYKNVCVGDYYADIVVDATLMIELKCVRQFAGEHLAQCLHYLYASGLKTCLLVNFQNAKVDWRRISF
jgi:GxxExxY protein